jgi:hypothetical protein
MTLSATSDTSAAHEKPRDITWQAASSTTRRRRSITSIGWILNTSTGNDMVDQCMTTLTEINISIQDTMQSKSMLERK